MAKLTDEQKMERQALREIEHTVEKLDKQDKAREEKPKKKSTSKKKFGNRVHVLPETILHCRATFIEEVLGSSPGDPQIYSTYLASKAPDAKTTAEEIAMYGEEEIEEQKTTIFFKNKDGDYCILDYQIRGFLKAAAKALKRAGMLEIAAYKTVISDLVKISAKPDPYILDRWIPLIPPKGQRAYLFQRPLKGSTPQGEIIALASSETLPAGTKFEFYIHLLTDEIKDATLSWMEFGRYVGLLQWRSAGYGRFTIEVEQNGKWMPLEKV